ncbi:tetratricopeptide repeat protein [Devosia sp.]|uniref:tetratricopeptide repeat protein n=1 Tax=Devosia sp. TaxID=1871048 RepID=UPI002733AFEF|nr:tetratricopeptide repeat protein [Devosia sp.]MDP2781896.1 tetratricopeptide repeat protein [Devosia sp.]
MPLIVCALLGFAQDARAQGLAPELQVDLAIAALERAILAEDNGEILDRIDVLRELAPVLAGGELLYFEAAALAEQGEIDEAEHALTRFLSEVGQQSASYDEALSLMLDLSDLRAELATLDRGVAAHERHDYDEARRLLAPLSAKGHAEAQYRIGMMDYYGLGGSAGVRAAERLYRLAAEQGHARAQASLAALYYNQEDGLLDDDQVAHWYRLSAEQGDPMGQMGMGYAYFEGLGVPQSYEQAVQWYRRAAENGDVQGQLAMGSMYEEGLGVAIDLAEARRWYRMAADQGTYFAEEALVRLGQ